MIDANKPMTINLTAGAMDVVMRALYIAYEAPYRNAQSIIDDLRRQILEAEPQAFEVAAAPRVNGLDVPRGANGE